MNEYDDIPARQIQTLGGCWSPEVRLDLSGSKFAGGSYRGLRKCIGKCIAIGVQARGWFGIPLGVSSLARVWVLFGLGLKWFMEQRQMPWSPENYSLGPEFALGLV